MGKKKKHKIRRIRKGAGFKKKLASFVTIAMKVLPIIVISVMVYAAYLGVNRLLYQDDHLNVKVIKINPPLSITAEQRRELEAKYLHKNILIVNLAQISRELESDPLILSARVVRKFPSYIDIDIVKREPVGYVRMGGSDFYALVAQDGMILDLIKEPQKGMLIIDADFLDKNKYKMGVQIKHRGLNSALSFAKKYWETPLAEIYTLDKLKFDHSGSVSAVFNAGPVIKMGRNPEGGMDSLEKVLQLIDSDQKKEIDYIDLQYDNVIVKKKR